jgi:hypothetical protein
LPVTAREAGRLRIGNPGTMMSFDRSYQDSRILVTGDGLKKTIAYFRHSLERS